jgi:hypothetical protein
MDEDQTTTTTESTTNNNQHGDDQPTDGNQMSDEQRQADAEAMQSQETVTTTVTNEAGVAPVAEKQGEVAIDKDAKADVLGGGPADPEADQQAQTDNIAQAKADGLRNHAAHVAEQSSTNTQPADTPSE